MNKLIAIAFVLVLFSAGCKPKASKEQKSEEPVQSETVVQPNDDEPSSVERIDSITTELEKSIDELDEALNDLK